MHLSLAYVILFLYLLFYADDGGKRKAYVPKRQRHTWHTIWAYTNRLNAWITALFTAFEHKIQNLQTKSTIRHRQRVAQRYHHSTGNNQPPWGRQQARRLPFMAQEALLAQQAQTSKQRRTIILDTDSQPIGIDNRATAFFSGCIDDFQGPLQDSKRTVKGFGGSRTTGVKIGTAVIRIEDDEGRVHKFILPNSFYVPGTSDRLLSPQHWSQCLRKAGIHGAKSSTTHDQVTLTWGKFKRTVPLDSVTNVATIYSAPGHSKFMAFCSEAGFEPEEEDSTPLAFSTTAYVTDDEYESDSEDDDDEAIEKQLPNTAPCPKQANIVEEEEVQAKIERDEAELLQYHYRFGHASFSKLQEMARQRIIPYRLRNCRIPVCAACMYGKATKKQWRQKAPTNAKSSSTLTKPGQVVSVDQLESPTPGFVAQLTGILTNKRYKYVTVFVDGYTGYGYVHLQKSSGSEETLEAKHMFEQICARAGHRVEHYHADNGIFIAHAWKDDCRRLGQGFSYAGVDAHHQNGKAEARIRRLQELARAMLNHAKRRWPQEVNTNLWPYAIRMASMSINSTPNMGDKAKRSPSEMFEGTEIAVNPKHWRHIFCPVYVLDSNLRSGKHMNKWRDRARVGINLGPSPQHARNVVLVLNIETGLVSPQFHVKFDPNFDTVKQLYEDSMENHESRWQIKSGFINTGSTATEERPPEGMATTPSVPPSRQEEHTDQQDLQPVRTDTADVMVTESNPSDQTQSPADARSKDVDNQLNNDGNMTQREPQQVEPVPAENRGHNQQPRRSGRNRRPVERLIEAMTAELQGSDSIGEIFSYTAQCKDLKQIDVTSDLMAMKAKADPDTLYLHEAQRQPDWQDFADAMQLEIDQQVSLGLYEIVHISQVPEGATLLNAVWQLRRKRDVRTGEIKKYKARCNIDGSKMKKGEHYEETYAPVAGWTAIRLLLALVLLLGWATVQLDYVLAFPQAPAVRDLFMRIPRGFTLDGVDDPSQYVLKVKRNTYGGKDSGRTWFLYLRSKLLKLGFVQSKFDECLFYKGSMVYVIYTDDSILAGPNQQEIDETINLMKKELDITIEGTLSDFLGVNIDRRKDGTIKLSQPKLIEQILQDLRLTDHKVQPKPTPAASSKLVSRHSDSRPFDNSFNYRSVIGKLHYLVAGSRSECAYVVHQCARFSHDPKMEHGQAVRWIGRYLKGTKNEGTILKPDKSKSLEVFVDADFAGNWDKSLAGLDRSTARSRHGFYICYGGIPIAWKSSLQQEIALSSTESEITGMSYALREAIPVMNLLQEMQDKGYPIGSSKAQVHCKVFEDNSGAIEIAKTAKFRPRTKHLNNRLFHFRTYIDRGLISIHPIKSRDQPADILTKPLNEEDFKRHRKIINGW